ncbi:MAG: dNTP triphosphohydrolase [Phycisphaerales bacterium]|nr:dNTP triphosphohydrolase [Phycisphaerales bacterium]
MNDPRVRSALDWSREHADPLADALLPLALDRQRIVRSAAFRRLQYKTQVFVATEEDHFRTRLTHTLEVAHLARLIAARLDLNSDLAEVVALAHDLGHPPFGHAGEQALNDAMSSYGGFEHNVHALRVVDHLEHPYPDFRGLNLTCIVRVCLAKHSTRFDEPAAHALQDGQPPPPEGQAAALADRFTYGQHDLADGLYAGLIDFDALMSVDLWRRSYHGPTAPQPPELRRHLRPALDRIQSRLLDGVTMRQANLAIDETTDAEFAAIESLLLRSLYRHDKLVRMDARARRVITAVLEAFVADPSQLPARFARRIAEESPQRVAADYVAGMTDRFCLREYRRLFDPRVQD